MPPYTHNSAGSRSNTKSALVERTSVMRHPILMLHLLGLRLTDQLRQHRLEVTLQLDAHIAAPEQTDEPIEQPADAVMPCIEQRAACEGDEPGGEALELFEHERPLTLRRAQLHAGDETTEVLVTLC